MAKRRMRKFADGGDTGLREGRNRNNDDATRARALEMLARMNESSSEDQDMADEAKMAASRPSMKRPARPVQVKRRPATADSMDMPTAGQRMRMAQAAAGMDMPPVAPRRVTADSMDMPLATARRAVAPAEGVSMPTAEQRMRMAQAAAAMDMPTAASSRRPVLDTGPDVAEVTSRGAPVSDTVIDTAPVSKRAEIIPKALRTRRIKKKEDSEESGGRAKKMAKGGMVRNRGDGIARRGLTKGRFVK